MNRLPLPFAIAVALPGTYLGAAAQLGLPRPDLPAPVAALVFGVAIIGAAFVLSWAAEAAQVDISAGLALAVLALLAVLPEYAVDFVFTRQAGVVFAAEGRCAPGPDGADPCTLALANMTGANRVLVGLGWPLVILVSALAVARARRRRSDVPPNLTTTAVRMPRAMSAEVVFLGIATVYSLTLPLRSSLTILDAVFLVAIFVAYAVRLAHAPAEEPDLIGTSAWIGGLPTAARRWTYTGLFVVAAGVILACAEEFANGLVDTGTELGIDQFILVQWVAPVASEAPELIVACLYASRLKAGDSLGALLSSKVNQWTLLVGTIPIVFAVSSGSFTGLPLDDQQRQELLLTAAQSFFAVSLLLTLRLSARGAGALFALFIVQFIGSITQPVDVDRILVLVLSGVYLVLGVLQLVRHRKEVLRTSRDGVVTPFDELEEADRVAASTRTDGGASVDPS